MLVSILIPVFNASAYLDRTIQSCLEQTYQPIEIILVDDGSNDRSVEIAKSYEKKGLVTLFQQTNAGACVARNKAFELSAGDYIQYLDADDILSANKIQYQMELMSQSPSDSIMSCAWVRFDNENEINSIKPIRQSIDQSWDNPIDWLINAWQGKGMAQTSIWLTPRHLIEKAGGWNEQLSVNQDGEFFCRVLLKAADIKFTDKSIVYYRSGNRRSLSQTKNYKKVADLLLSYKLNEVNTLRKIDNTEVRKALGHNYTSFIYQYYNKFPDLVNQARDMVKRLGLKKQPLVGGLIFKISSRLLGFDNALKIKFCIQKFASSE